jgi:hypothetical protein
VGEHASSAPLMRVLYWKFITANAAARNFIFLGSKRFFIRKLLPNEHFAAYLTQFDIKKEIFVNKS